jgi:ankyrin repeat protein
MDVKAAGQAKEESVVVPLPPWVKAAREGRWRALEQHGASVINARDANGCSPLCWASAFGRENCVAWLLLQRCELEFADVDGRTALHLAIVYGHSAVVAQLLAARAK